MDCAYEVLVRHADRGHWPSLLITMVTYLVDGWFGACVYLTCVLQDRSSPSAARSTCLSPFYEVQAWMISASSLRFPRDSGRQQVRWVHERSPDDACPEEVPAGARAFFMVATRDEPIEVACSRQKPSQGGDLLIRPRSPQGLQKAFHAIRVVEGAVGSRIAV
jgi:hypothetical protein